MNKRIRATVVERAGGNCEACGKSLGPESERGHFDHFFSRRNSEEVETGWLICPPCDEARTQNRPSATYWLAAFALHALKHGYADANFWALSKISVLAVRGLTP